MAIVGLSEQDRNLYNELAGRLGASGSKVIRLIMEKLMTPEEAKVVLALPASAEEIANKLSMKKEFVDETLNEMYEKGVCVLSRKGYRMIGSVIQLHDMRPIKKWADILGPEYFDLWGLYEITEKYENLRDVFHYVEYPVLKVIPRWRAIKDNPGLIPTEDLRELLKDRELIGINYCSCREVNYDCACQAPGEVCLFFDRIAEYEATRGMARIISYDEAIETYDMISDYPLVTLGPNEKRPRVICNCGIDHCVEFRSILAGEGGRFRDPSKVEWKEHLYRARYLAEVDELKCNGCQTCIEKWCVFGAIQMRPSGGLKKWKALPDPDKCMGCGLCVVKCPKQAITLVLVRPDQVYPETRATPGSVSKEQLSETLKP